MSECLAWGFFGVEAFYIGAFSSGIFRAGPLNIGVFNIPAGPVAPWMLHCRTPLEAPLRPQRDLGVHRHKDLHLRDFVLKDFHLDPDYHRNPSSRVSWALSSCEPAPSAPNPVLWIS